MSNQVYFALLVGGMGIICLIFPHSVARLLSAVTQFSAKKSNEFENNQSWARPLFIRMMGIGQLGLAALVYFGKIALYGSQPIQ